MQGYTPGIMNSLPRVLLLSLSSLFFFFFFLSPDDENRVLEWRFAKYGGWWYWFERDIGCGNFEGRTIYLN